MTQEAELRPCPHCGYFQLAEPCPLCGGRVLDGPLGAPIRPGRKLAPLEIAHGFVTFYRAGLHLLTRPEYFGRLAVPMTANLVAALLLAALTFWGIWPAMAWLVAQSWGALELLRGPVPWSDANFAVVLTSVVLVFVGPVLMQTLTIPFLDPLADAVEKMLGGPRLQAREQSAWRNLAINVRASAQVLAMQALALVPCLLLSFCHLGLLLALFVAAFLGALLWYEVPFARRGYSIEQRIRIVRHNWGRALGLGLAFELGLFLPFFNVFLLAPTAAVAVTMTYFHFEKVPPGGIVRPPPPVAEAASAGPAADPAAETLRDG